MTMGIDPRVIGPPDPVEDRVLIDESELRRRLQVAYELGYDAGWNEAVAASQAKTVSDKLAKLLGLGSVTP